MTGTFAESWWPQAWRSDGWAGFVVLAALVLAGLLAWSWRAIRRTGGVGAVASILKASALAILLLVLLEPVRQRREPQPQANRFAVVVDTSRSVAPTDSGGEVRSRLLDDTAAWQTQLAADFDVRRFSLGSRLRTVDRFPKDATDTGSRLGSGLTDVLARLDGQSLAGVLLLSDGNATDDLDPAALASAGVPIYPVPVGPAEDEDAVRIASLSSREANFEAAPVTITASVDGATTRPVTVRLLDPAGAVVQTSTVESLPARTRFELRGSEPGIQFYRVEATTADDDAVPLNNARTLVVNRAGGPHRVLYVCGRPNWEFKFLRRALQEDDVLDLVGLIRIAKKEPKFAFRKGGQSNALFQGFDADEEQAEQYDEPVLLRFGTRDADELRGGFPKTADELFGFDAIVLDDLEAAFFTQDQKQLVQEFVRRRGGGLLMLGGGESFGRGGYARTPIGEMLPIYADRPPVEQPPGEYRLRLSREGWLQPWTRLRSTEAAERKRLSQVPPFITVNRTPAIKPGSHVLAEVESPDGESVYPALVTQPFGRGQVGALLIGDLWRSQMRRREQQSEDFGRGWRQMIRWLVSDVPGRVDVAVDPDQQSGNIHVVVRDEQFNRLDNATVTLTVTGPEGEPRSLATRPAADRSGEYVATLQPRETGGYRVAATVTAADGSEVGEAETGVVFDPLAEELQRVTVNRPVLDELAEATGGEVVASGELRQFVASLQSRELPVMRTTTEPYWHNWPLLLTVLGLLAGEWGLRRWKGLP